MKPRFLFAAIFVLLMAACSSQADKVVGNYTGQYTFSSSTYYNITAAATKEGDNMVTIAFSGVGISNLTVTGISVTANGDNSSLTKGNATETFSGIVVGNNINLTYNGPTGAASYIGTK